MVRVKDAELQKLRSQVKNLENNLERTTEVRTMIIRFCGICNKEIGFHLFDPPLLTFEIMLINLFWIWTYFIVYISHTYTNDWDTSSS